MTLTFEQPVLCDTAAGRDAAQLTPDVTAGLTAAAADHRQGQLCKLWPPASDLAVTQAAGRQLSLETYSQAKLLIGHLKPSYWLISRAL